MALKGTLGDFSIGEIFQLIGQQQKTGVLSVSREATAVHVIFDGGRVVGAAEGSHGEDDRLVERLERMGILSPGDIRVLREAQSNSILQMAEFLSSRGALTREDFAHYLGLEIQNTLLHLFLWADGQYEFTPRQVRFEKEFTPGVPAEELLLDGLRAKDEWASIARLFPAWDAVPEQVPGVAVEDGTVPGSEVDRRVRELIDGTSTVRAIIDRSRLSDFEASRILANLVDRGYIRVTTGPPRDGGPGRRQNRFPPAALAACAAAVIVCGLLLGSLAGAFLWSARGDRGLSLRGPGPESVLASNVRARLRAALELYRIENGEYPDRLEALAQAGLISSRDAGAPLHYETQGDRYALLMRGW
ncbi:MAG: DUF4388 domain-containing protein [Myxococcota bacterium]